MCLIKGFPPRCTWLRKCKMLLEKFEYAQLVCKHKAKSKAWTHFGFPADATGMVINKNTICQLCKVNMTYSGNTSNLTYHLWQVHPRRTV